MAAQGVERRRFAETLNSLAVQSQVARAVELAKTYDIDSVPTLIVGGKYLTSAAHAGSQESLPPVLNELVQLVRTERLVRR